MQELDADPIAALENLKQRLQRVVLTEAQFAAALDPVLATFAGKGLYITVNVSDRSGTPQKTYGSSPDASLTDGTRQEDRADTATALISIVAENRAGVDSNKMRQLFTRVLEVLNPLLALHWGTRDSFAFVFNDLQKDRFRTATREAVAASAPVAIVAFDLDRFKEVNDTFGHQVGDDVLRGFGRRLRTRFADASIIGRFGGEEFALVWPDVRLDVLVKALTEFRQQQEQEPYEAIDRPNTCSIGVAVFPEFVSGVATEPYDDLYGVADAACYAAKNAGRNRIRWGSDRPPTAVVENFDETAMVQIALNAKVFARGERIAKYGPLQLYIYGELRERLRLCPFPQIRESVERLLAEVGVDVSPNSDPGRPTVSRRELVEIVATALLGNALAGAGPLAAENRVVLRAPADAGEITFDIDGQYSVALPVQADTPAEIDFGQIWRDRELANGGVPRYVANDTSLSPYVTIAVGADNLERHGVQWSGATIPADDRPVTGGGLPDFWQSNVTRAVQAVLANPNARVIVILGEEATARRTITMLKLLVSQEEWRITRRLGLEPPVLREFVERKISLEVVANDAEPFLELVRRIVFDTAALFGAVGQPRAVAAEAEQRARFSILAPRDTVLGDTDGMRVSTLADAYPRVIQLLRSSKLQLHSDFMHREFVELTAFKISFSTPTNDIVPEYWSDDTKELTSYYEQQFRASDGLFGSHLQTWEDGKSQITEAVAATTEALISGVASRRILLLVVPRPSDDWHSPLGLIGAIVFPRIHGEQRRLDFLWMWRTVEALVGFPFSAYGSIRESTFLLDEVNAKLRAEGEREAICGEVTYLAASLHFFVGAGDAEIARTVVRDAIR